MDLDREVLTVLRGDVSLDDATVRARFDGYFTRYYFGILTHPGHLSEWVDRRTDFLDRRLSQARSERVHTHVVNLAFQTMSVIVKDEYHPAARYNAMLLIGMLNSTEGSTVGDRRPPVPLISALRFMLDELQDPAQIDAVRVAALNGILRHARIDRDLPSDNRRLIGNNAETMIVDAMVQLLTAKEPPEGRNVEGHAWMRRRAADVLGMLGSIGQGRVVNALEEVLADETADIAVRCSAAEALGRLNYPSDANINVVEIARKLGIVAAWACYEEIERVEQQQAREGTTDAAGSGAGMMAGGYGGTAGMFGSPTGRSLTGGGGPLGYRLGLTRRRVKQQMLQVRSGLTGPGGTAAGGLAAVAGDAGEQVTQFVDAIDAIISVTDDSTFGNLTALITELRTRVRRMEEDCNIVVLRDDDEGLDALMQPLEDGLLELPGDPPADDDREPDDQPRVDLPDDLPVEELDLPVEQPDLPMDEPDLPLDLPVEQPDFDDN